MANHCDRDRVVVVGRRGGVSLLASQRTAGLSPVSPPHKPGRKQVRRLRLWAKEGKGLAYNLLRDGANTAAS